MSPPGTTIDEAARTLVAAFYRGLGTSPSAATIAMQRRDLAIARQLVHAGATPHEAETYAREMSGLEGRLAPVDLRSFERERPCWLARQHRREKRHVDRTGLPPSWQAQPGTPNAPTAGIPEPPPSTGCTRLAAPADEHRALTGQHLGRALRAVLAGGGG
jgi:hypothetical protein